MFVSVRGSALSSNVHCKSTSGVEQNVHITVLISGCTKSVTYSSFKNIIFFALSSTTHEKIELDYSFDY